MEIDGEQCGQNLQCGNAITVRNRKVLRYATRCNFLKKLGARLADGAKVRVRVAGQSVACGQTFDRRNDHFPTPVAFGHMEHGFDAGREHIPHKRRAGVPIIGLCKAGVAADDDILRALRGIVWAGVTGGKNVAVAVNIKRLNKINPLTGDQM